MLGRAPDRSAHPVPSVTGGSSPPGAIRLHNSRQPAPPGELELPSTWNRLRCLPLRWQAPHPARPPRAGPHPAQPQGTSEGPPTSARAPPQVAEPSPHWSLPSPQAESPARGRGASALDPFAISAHLRCAAIFDGDPISTMRRPCTYGTSPTEHHALIPPLVTIRSAHQAVTRVLCVKALASAVQQAGEGAGVGPPADQAVELMILAR